MNTTIDSIRRLFQAARAPGCRFRCALSGLDFLSDNGDLLKLALTLLYSRLGNNPAVSRVFPEGVEDQVCEQQLRQKSASCVMCLQKQTSLFTTPRGSKPPRPDSANAIYSEIEVDQ